MVKKSKNPKPRIDKNTYVRLKLTKKLQSFFTTIKIGSGVVLLNDKTYLLDDAYKLARKLRHNALTYVRENFERIIWETALAQSGSNYSKSNSTLSVYFKVNGKLCRVSDHKSLNPEKYFIDIVISKQIKQKMLSEYCQKIKDGHPQNAII